MVTCKLFAILDKRSLPIRGQGNIAPHSLPALISRLKADLMDLEEIAWNRESEPENQEKLSLVANHFRSKRRARLSDNGRAYLPPWCQQPL